MEWVVEATTRSLYFWVKEPVRIVEEAGWVPGPGTKLDRHILI